MGVAAEKMSEFGGETLNLGGGDAANGPVSRVADVVRLRPEAIDRALLAFPAELIGLLPVPVALDLGTTEGRRFSVVFDDEVARQRRQSGGVVLDAADWEVVVTATESDRLRPMDVVEVLSARREGPLVRDAVMGGARPDPARGWSLARVLARLGVVVHGAALLEPSLPAAA